jgi:methylmalonyl-CoA mutase C-terminal domain/subunit
MGGGIIPEEDIKKLLQMGVKRIFTPGAPTNEIVDYINSIIH